MQRGTAGLSKEKGEKATEEIAKGREKAREEIAKGHMLTALHSRGSFTVQ